MRNQSPLKLRGRPAAICAAFGVASAMAVGGVMIAPTVADAAATNVAQFHMLNDGNSTSVADAAKYQVVQLQYSSTVKSLVDQIHADDPGVKVLMYTDAVPAGTGGSTDGWTTCTTSTQDAAGGDSWSLYDGGSRLNGSMNPGTAAYQAACTSHATALAKSADFDGVFWDEVAPQAAFSESSSCVNAEGGGSCWSTATWQANEYSLVQAIGAASSADGLMAIINDGTGTTAQFAQWASTPGISGSMEESFVGSYLGTSVPYAQWQEEIANEVWSEANGKYFMGVHYDPNQNQESLDTFGLSSMLLAAGNMSSYDSTVTTLNDAAYDWWPEYTASQTLGAPQGAYTTVSSGGATVYERKFANGIVVVNPTTSGSAAVALGATYKGSGNEPASVTSVTLPAQSGMILTGASPTTAPAVAPTPAPTPTAGTGKSSGSGSHKSGKTTTATLPKQSATSILNCQTTVHRHKVALTCTTKASDKLSTSLRVRAYHKGHIIAKQATKVRHHRATFDVKLNKRRRGTYRFEVKIEAGSKHGKLTRKVRIK